MLISIIGGGTAPSAPAVVTGGAGVAAGESYVTVLTIEKYPSDHLIIFLPFTSF